MLLGLMQWPFMTSHMGLDGTIVRSRSSHCNTENDVIVASDKRFPKWLLNISYRGDFWRTLTEACSKDSYLIPPTNLYMFMSSRKAWSWNHRLRVPCFTSGLQLLDFQWKIHKRNVWQAVRGKTPDQKSQVRVGCDPVDNAVYIAECKTC